VPGRKTLTPDGDCLWMHGRAGRELVGLKLSPNVAVGEAFAYVLPAGAPLRTSRYTLQTALSLLQMEPRATTSTALARPPHGATVHMRTLQALDGVAAGASHRTIAGVLFGAERVAAEWQADSELRAHVRYLIQRGRSAAGNQWLAWARLHADALDPIISDFSSCTSLDVDVPSWFTGRGGWEKKPRDWWAGAIVEDPDDEEDADRPRSVAEAPDPSAHWRRIRSGWYGR
jgi:hypothetical protein